MQLCDRINCVTIILCASFNVAMDQYVCFKPIKLIPCTHLYSMSKRIRTKNADSNMAESRINQSEQRMQILTWSRAESTNQNREASFIHDREQECDRKVDIQ